MYLFSFCLQLMCVASQLGGLEGSISLPPHLLEGLGDHRLVLGWEQRGSSWDAESGGSHKHHHPEHCFCAVLISRGTQGKAGKDRADRSFSCCSLYSSIKHMG